MSRCRTWSKTTVVVAIAVACLPSLPASAQLEEVIVTAQKRSESVQDVPIAITAFDDEAIKARQIVGFADLRFSAPNVNYSKTNFSGNNFQIRGVGTNLVAASSDGGVGVHVNEVPLITPRLFETEYFDVAQVMVLRGPQGTLYGRNSTGGAINMITHAAHTEGFEGNLEAQYGNYDHTKLVGSVNLPLGEHFAARLAGLYLQREGYTDNLYTGNDVDDRDQYSLRASFNYSGENTTANLMISYFEEDSSRSRSQNMRCKNDPSGLLGCLPDALAAEKPHPSSQMSNLAASDANLGPFAIYELGSNGGSFVPADIREVYSDFDPVYETDETLVTLRVEHRLEQHSLSLVAGYQDTAQLSQQDFTWNVGLPVDIPARLEEVAPENYAALYAQGLPLSAPSANSTGIVGGHIQYYSQGLESYDQSNRDSEQYSLEFRVQSEYEGPLNFLAGGFWMDAELEDHFWVFSNGFDYVSGVAAALGFGADGSGWVSPMFHNENEEYKLETRALFGELYYQPGDALKLTLGLRYTMDEKSVRDRSLLLNYDLETGVLPLLQPLGADQPIPIPFRDDSEEWDELTGRLVLDWALNNDSLAYASYSRGYKGGGFNPPFDPVDFPSQKGTFDPEFVHAYELGVKNTLLDNTLQANFTAFFYDYEDMQTSKIINRTSFNENNDAEIYGLEAEFLFAPAERWQLNANLAYLHTEVEDFSSFDTRDPTAGRDDVTLIKDIRVGTNCVVMMEPGEFRQSVGSQFNSCAALRESGLQVTDGIPVNLDGNELLNSPQWSLSLGAQYHIALPRDYALSLRLDYYWQDDMYTRLFNREVDKVDDWDIWNAQANLTSPHDSWYLRVYIKNIANDDNVVGAFLSSAEAGLFTNMFVIEPRTYGLAVGYNFQ